MPFHRTYKLRAAGARYIAMRSADVHAGLSPLPAQFAARVIERALMNPGDVNQLAELAHAIDGGTNRGAVKGARMLRAVQSGQWVLFRENLTIPVLRLPTPEPVAEQLKKAKVVKTWVEMEVVDENGKPVIGRGFTCMLPDGAIQTGTLDNKGRVRFEGIDPGNCAFSLTDTHAADWDWAA
ncbi:MAG: hypothetical protein HYX27_16765 [Acidobacteria bacterium]|nr:hypothetical protein [Acidobacteriota bacterium]